MMRNDVPVIGLTGNTGSGKTTVARQLAGYGGIVIDADALAHRVMKRGQPAYEEIVALFGDDLLAADGEIDRKKLGAVVFNDRERLTCLESIIHPRVRAETFNTLEKVRQGEIPGAFIVIDAPLLIEAGMHLSCDSVWVVTAPAAVKEQRITLRDGLTREIVERRMNSQHNENELTSFADTVIVNDGDADALVEKVRIAFERTAAKLGIQV